MLGYLAPFFMFFTRQTLMNEDLNFQVLLSNPVKFIFT